MTNQYVTIVKQPKRNVSILLKNWYFLLFCTPNNFAMTKVLLDLKTILSYFYDDTISWATPHLHLWKRIRKNEQAHH